MSRIAYLTAAALLASLAMPVAARDLDEKKKEAVFKALNDNCGRCHADAGANNAGGGFDWLFDVKKLADKKTIVVGKADDSKLYKRIKGGSMPPEDEKPRPTEADMALIKEWIDGGAPPLTGKTDEKRPVIEDTAVLATILDHLNTNVDPRDHRYMRFFSMHHLHNNPAVSNEDLRWYRAGMSKVANSLSWNSRIYVPPAIDKYGTIFAVDVRKYDWDRKDLPFWEAMTRLYPYGLSYDAHQNRALSNMANTIYKMTNTKLPFLRADWFIAVCSRPPLYHVGLQIPKTGYELEKRLGVNAIENILHDKVARAGFQKSGVSSQNRLVERHQSNFGWYYKSYDFIKDNGRGNLLSFPLGPKFAQNPYPEQAFTHDGGEMIFTLPNGMQGYMLVKGDDTRINAGPTEVVSDPGRISGKIEIVNGISCMGCHIRGIYPFPANDDVRDGAIGLFGNARLKVQALYKQPKEMKELLDDDEERFLRALDKTIGPYLRTAGNENKKIEDFISDEPVRRLSARYNRNLTLADAAAELSVPPQTLAGAIQFNPNIQRLGLGAWASPGGTISRDRWQLSPTGKGRMSVFQMVASELNCGDPQIPTGPVE
ncbi:MAG: hypothetical protein U0746_20500 [Gemmataceae bacterium]